MNHFFSYSLFLGTILTALMQCINDPPITESKSILLFNNQSSDSIIVRISYDYPDTLCPSFSRIADGGFCPPLQTSALYSYSDRDILFQQNRIIQLFIFNDLNINEHFKIHPIDEPVDKYHLILKRYELTRDWLEQHDWTVTYP